MSERRFARRLELAIQQRVLAAHRKVRAKGRSFLGRAAVLAQSFMKRAASFEPKRLPVPTVAASDHGAKARALGVLKRFRAAYRAALATWREGLRDVVFPHGTWWMRVLYGAEVAPG